ncbi:cytochrome c oxidase assembly factor 7 homolog [Copidosoma floridanum]|uniref:cytochrome c oxidase assembly factor 7 homolog n=1 Tax=Copidosoma floridanum TaxID=29053 RepID=UPI0006C9AB7B|nr:cytochrome c oxidase assembly factor 7 homolog [Copidosoma floridanum]
MAGYDFKDEEQVREYLKNLYTEYKFGCYGEKKPEVCHLLGDYNEAIKKDFKQAASIYEKNCNNLDYGRSCAKLGGWKLIGKGCKKNIVEAFQYMKKGCDFGDGIGCTNAGIVSITNVDVNRENKQAVIQSGINMLSKGCVESKNEKACYFLTGLFINGIDGIVEKSPLEAYKYSLLACEYGVPNACMYISRLHELGEGVEKNPKLAETFRLRYRDLEQQYRQLQPTIEFGQGIEP